MPEISEQKSPYMDLNSFLREFHTLFTDNKFNNDLAAIKDIMQHEFARNRVNFNRVSNQQNIQQLADIYDLKMNSDEAQDLATQILASLADPSQEASDFLNMANTFILQYQYNAPQSEKDQAIRTQLYLVSNNKIKDPKLSKFVLDNILGRTQNKEIEIAVKHLLALHPLATVIDVNQYASDIRSEKNSPLYAKAPEELYELLDKQIKQMDATIKKELDKDFPNQQFISQMRPGLLANVATNISTIISEQKDKGMRTPEEVLAALNLTDELTKKYNINSILEFKQGNYITEYEKSAEHKLAEQSVQLERANTELTKTTQQLNASQKYGNEMRKTLDERFSEIRELQDKIAKLESENGTLKSKNAVMLGTIKTFIKEATERAKGGVLNKGKDLADKIAEFAKHFEAKI